VLFTPNCMGYESGQWRGVLLYGLDIGTSWWFELKTSESGRGVPEALPSPEVVLAGAWMYCFRAGRGVGVKIGTFLNGDGVGDDLRSMAAGDLGIRIVRGCSVSTVPNIPSGIEPLELDGSAGLASGTRRILGFLSRTGKFDIRIQFCRLWPRFGPSE
jgi:hypothetical protein